MKIDSTQVVIRERTAWEACDLGLAMALRWWLPIMPTLLLVSVPPFLLLNAVFAQHPSVALLIVWWLKPVLERVPLAVVARGFFATVGRPREILHQMTWPSAATLLASLTVRRLTLWRSFVAPVEQLEKQTGEARHRRINVLLPPESGPAVFLTICGLATELTIWVSFYIFIAMLVPSGFDIDIGPPAYWEEVPVYQGLLSNTVFFVAQVLVMPFYVAAGFSLYIKRRVDLEGWDLEIAFRQLRQRLEAAPGDEGNRSSRSAAG